MVKILAVNIIYSHFMKIWLVTTLWVRGCDHPMIGLTAKSRSSQQFLLQFHIDQVSYL